MNDNPQTPEEVGAWIAAHGGPAGGEGPDASGRIVQRAADGSTIVQQVQPGGAPRVVEVRAAGPGSTPAAPPAQSPAQPGPGGSGMDQQALQALLAGIAPGGDVGKLEFSQGSRKKIIRGVTGADKEVETPYVLWIDRATGRTVEADVEPGGGSYTVTFNGTKPENKATERQQGATATTPYIEGTPIPGRPGEFDNTRPIKVNRDANGNQVGPAQELNAQEREQWEREKNGGKTDAEIRAESKEERDERPVASHPGWTQITVKKDGTTKTTFRGPDGKESDSLPPAPTAAKPEQDANGNWGYWDTKPGQPPKWVPIEGNTPAGAGPKPVEVNGVWGVWKPGENGGAPTFVPVPNAPKDPERGPYTGPSMPQIVVGHTTASLQALAEQLARDPNLTPTQRAAMWAQAVQVAGMAIQEAGIKQREAESNLNAQVNIATTKLTAEQNAFNNALKVATDLNDKLPPGSDLGGQAFAAMLGMSLVQAHRSGIYDIKPPGTPVTDAASRPAPPTLANPTDRATVEAQRQQTQAQLQQAQAPADPAQAPAPAPPPPGAPTAPVPAAASTAPPVVNPATGDASGLPGTPYAPPVPAPVVPPPAEDPTDTLVIVHRQSGARQTISRAIWDRMGVNQGEYDVEPGSETKPPAVAAPPVPSPAPQYGKPGADPSFTSVPEQNPGGSVLPPPMPSAPGNVQQMPQVPQFAALAPYRPQPMAPPVPGQATPNLSKSPAMLQARAASVPPWRLTPEERAEMEAAGIDPSVIYAVPGLPGGRVA